jgi:hypothetical protein
VDGGDLGLIAPSRRDVRQALQGNLPVVATAYEADGLRVSAEAWVCPGEDGDWTAVQVVLFNIADLPLTGHFFFAIRPYNPEGIAPVYSLSYHGHEMRFARRRALVTWPRPDAYHLAGLRDGDLFVKLGGAIGAQPVALPSQRTRLRDPHGFAHGALQFAFNIEPWEEAEFIAFMPMRRPGLAGVSRPLATTRGERRMGAGRPFPAHEPIMSRVQVEVRNPDPQIYSRAKAATTLGWRELLESGTRLSLPHRELQNSWEASRCHILALHDGNEITPGPDLYHSFWFRDAAYMLYALSICGYRRAATQLLLGFLKRQRRNGAFVSHYGEWDSTGQVLWAAARHLELHPDSALLAELGPAISRGAAWITRALDKGGGLMPPGISSEHLGPPDRYYWDALWSLAGLEAARDLLADGYASIIRKLRSTLLRAWKRDTQRLGRQALPAAPGRGIDLGMVGTLAAWFPLRLIPSGSPLLGGTLAALEEVAFYEGALFVHAGHSGWGTYLNMRVAGCRLLGSLPGGWALMDRLLKHASPTLNWPEAIHPVSGRGSAGDGHHGWASAEWLMLVRYLLFDDTGDTLHITPHLPEPWLSQAGSIELQDAPTRYGNLSYTLEWEEGAQSLSLHIDPTWRSAPSSVRLGLPGDWVKVQEPALSLPKGSKFKVQGDKFQVQQSEYTRYVELAPGATSIRLIKE